MTGIRPLERDDLPSVASLYEHVMRSGSRAGTPALVSYFERTLFDYPWFDPELPSYVYTEDGRVIGFVACYTRRMQFEGRAIRLACSGQLVSDPDARNHIAGALLMRKLLSGPQELTITDGATDLVRQMWVRLGGVTTDLTSLRWIRVFRPWAYASGELARKLRVEGVQPYLRPVWAVLDAVTTRMASEWLVPERPKATSDQLTPEAVVQNLPELASQLRLYPGYDDEYVSWLFDELEQVRTRGRLVKSLVREGDRVLGWYVYYLKPHGISEVLQVAARDRDVDAVIDHLFHHAQANRSVALQGRMEPRLVDPLLSRHCISAPSRWTLVHSRDEQILSAIGSRDTLLTRLEGEWWMGHHTEPFR
jgi:hypothetical protein